MTTETTTIPAKDVKVGDLLETPDGPEVVTCTHEKSNGLLQICTISGPRFYAPDSLKRVHSDPQPEPDTALDEEAAETELTDVDEPAEGEESTGRLGVVAGGWCAPSEALYGLFDHPEVTARRGGLQFSFSAAARPLEEWSKKELRAEVTRLREALGKHQAARWKAQRKVRRLERKVKRLLKIIGRIA